jgi:hypothetical protein
MKTNIIVNLQFEGVHCWPDCNIPEVYFLKSPHRHIFHIQAKKQVQHDDRDIEFIRLKRQIQAYLKHTYPDGELGSNSCESIAKDILEGFELDYCSVLEDGENGAEVFKC